MKYSIMISSLMVLIASSAFAAEKKYECLPVADDDVQDSITLTVVSKEEVKVDDTKGSLDKAYAPRLNKSFVRFDLGSGGDEWNEALVQKKLLTGAAKGLLKLQGRGEVFSSEKYVCTKQ